MHIDHKKRHRIRRHIQILDILLALLLVGLAIISLINYQEIQDSVIRGVGNYGLIGVFFIISLLEIIPSIINPVLATWTAILLGYNFWLLMGVSVFASTFGSILGFYLGKKYGVNFVHLFFEDKTYFKVLNFWKKYGNIFVAVSALTPLPYLPLIFGSLNMKWRDFLIFGIVVRIFNFLIFGYLFYLGFLSI